MFANLILNDAPLITPAVEKRSPRPITKKRPASPRKSRQRSVSDISDNEHSRAEEIPEEISTANYSEDFSLVPTETSTPRPKPSRIEKQPQYASVSVSSDTESSLLSRATRYVSTDDQQVQVDLISAPFQSSLNQGELSMYLFRIPLLACVAVHSIFLINENDLNEVRPSLLTRSLVEPHVLQSLMTTNPVLLAVDDLIREQSSLLRSFIHLQRTYYESTVRSIQPDHLYVTKDNTLRVSDLSDVSHTTCRTMRFSLCFQVHRRSTAISNTIVLEPCCHQTSMSFTVASFSCVKM